MQSRTLSGPAFATGTATSWPTVTVSVLEHPVYASVTVSVYVPADPVVGWAIAALLTRPAGDHA